MKSEKLNKANLYILHGYLLVHGMQIFTDGSGEINSSNQRTKGCNYETR